MTTRPLLVPGADVLRVGLGIQPDAKAFSVLAPALQLQVRESTAGHVPEACSEASFSLSEAAQKLGKCINCTCAQVDDFCSLPQNKDLCPPELANAETSDLPACFMTKLWPAAPSGLPSRRCMQPVLARLDLQSSMPMSSTVAKTSCLHLRSSSSRW